MPFDALSLYFMSLFFLLFFFIPSSYLIPLFLFFLLISLEAWRFLLIWGLEQTKSLAVPPLTISSENENLVNVFLLCHDLNQTVSLFSFLPEGFSRHCPFKAQLLGACIALSLNYENAQGFQKQNSVYRKPPLSRYLSGLACSLEPDPPQSLFPALCVNIERSTRFSRGRTGTGKLSSLSCCSQCCRRIVLSRRSCKSS